MMAARRTKTMSDDTVSKVNASLFANGNALSKAVDSDQLHPRHRGITVGSGIKPPYPPGDLAGLLELNGTHAKCVFKTAHREVGFGFEIVPYGNLSADDASDDERQTVEDFWQGLSTVWKLGVKGTDYTTPTELLEKARQDYHGVGWQAIEIMYAGADTEPQGMTYLPAKTVRVRKKTETDRGRAVAGHGYVQKRDGQTVYLAEAGDRHARADEDTQLYVDKHTGETYEGPPSGMPSGFEPANEVLYIPNPHPNADFYGIPDWIAELQTIMADHEARRFNRKRLENDLMMDYIIIVEGGELSEQSRNDIADHIQGLRDSDDPGMLVLEAEELKKAGIDVDSGVSIRVEPAAHFNDEDASFTEYRSMNEADIAQAHGVPLQALSRQDATNANTQEAIRSWVEEDIKPSQETHAERIYRAIHQQILGVTDWTIEFHTVGAKSRQREVETNAAIAEVAREVMTVGQLLELFDLDAPDAVANELVSSVMGPSTPGQALDDAISTQPDTDTAAAKAAERIQKAARMED